MNLYHLTNGPQLAKLHEQLTKLESLRDLLGNELTDQKRIEVESKIRTLVETGGGTFIGRDVEVRDGDFVGRDKWQIILGDQYTDVSPDQVSQEVLLQAYLRALAAECSRLPLGVVDPRFLQVGLEVPVPLAAVYVDLDMLTLIHSEHMKGMDTPLAQLTRRASGKRTPLMEAIANQEVTRIVLLGDTGSGKTTFVHYLTYILATGARDVLKADEMQDAAPLPIRLVLREVSAHCMPPGATQGQAVMLWDALRADLAARLGERAADVLFPYLQQRLLEDGCFVLLDGLDEVPETDRRRMCLIEAIIDLAASLPPNRSRVLVTARPYAYADPSWRLPGFQALVMAPFDDAQVERFITRWYHAVRTVMGWDQATAQERGERLQQALAERSYLADLATRPLLLTLMATLHTSWGQLPDDRADLYEETVKLLLSRWQRAREVKGPDGETVTEPGILRVLAVEEGSIRKALHQLAFQVHERQGTGTKREAIPADISNGEVLAAFASILPANFNPRMLLNYLETRAGLLVGHAPEVYAFPHRSIQEYLAACYLADRPDAAKELRQCVWRDLDWWREVFLLGVGKVKQGSLGNAVHVVNTLVPEGYQGTPELTDTHWKAAILAGHALVDLRFPEAAQGEPDFEAALKRVRQWLVALLETPDALIPQERVDGGDVLGKLGDPRSGIGVTGGTLGRLSFPDIVWAAIPAGPFLMGSREDDLLAHDCEKPQHTLDLPAFLISRFPITNAQYQSFVDGHGYDEPRYWTPEGWAWRIGEREPDVAPVVEEDRRKDYADWLAGRPVEKRDRPFWWGHPRSGLPNSPVEWTHPRSDLSNRPVVGVNWYEAMAYCSWLTEQLREWADEKLGTRQIWTKSLSDGLLQTAIHDSSFVVRLPSEAEWEKAARGTDGRRWPWGDKWIEGHANTAETSISQTCTVGALPTGASPYGVLDMAGNVWEWTRSRWGRMGHANILQPDYKYPYDPNDGREESSGSDLRVVRGGCWHFDQRYARCPFRFWDIPEYFRLNMGFRVIISLSPSES